MFDLYKVDALSSYVSIGCKIGYLIPLTNSQWYLADKKVGSTPTVNMSGLYGTIYWNMF